MKFILNTCHMGGYSEFNTQGLAEEAVNVLVLEAELCMVLYAD